jgi:cellulose synthase/poly-beta-1,6-N-acetylglucosamine synthase-like glycosyltransferase/peptidoglycan/xylan/chitin deacetylase (PgdA/CDA1 family)
LTTPSGRQSARYIREHPLRGHWIVLAVWLAALTASLLLDGYAHQMLRATDDTADSGPRSAGNVPREVTAGKPVLYVTADEIRSLGPADHVVALTFDDGPDPQWTPRLLDLLKQYGAHATFFVVGARAAQYPELVQRMKAEGHEIGIHTFTHSNFGVESAWRQGLELRLSQLAVAGAASTTTPLLRPPYSSGNAELDDASWVSIRRAADYGYLTVLSTLDSHDWRRPGVAKIVERATPKSQKGEVLVLHDGGGNRSQTLAALHQLLPALQRSGFRVETVSDAAGLSQLPTTASTIDHLKGRALILGMQSSHFIVRVLGWMLVGAGILTVLRAVMVVIGAHLHHRRRRRRGWVPPVTVPVSVIIPAFNERPGIEATVRSLVASDHPVHVVVVDDGSTDGTGDVVERLGLPNVTLLRQANAGKAAALNTGLSATRHELVIMVDADTVLEPDAVRLLIQPFIDPRVGAVAGNAKVANRRGIIGRWQHIEYVVGFNLDRRLFDLGECMPTVPGAIGAFRRTALQQIGGVSSSTLAEDTDLTMALTRQGWRVVYEESAVGWTEAPATLRALWRQRYRWCYGTLQSMWKHRGAALQGSVAGKLGRRGLGYLLLFQVLLPLLAPAVDVFALYALVFLDASRIVGVWLAFLILQLGLSLYAFRLDGERAGALLTLPLQQVIYRQLMYLVTMQSVVTALAGVRLRWHQSDRYGSMQVLSGNAQHPVTTAT